MVEAPTNSLTTVHIINFLAWQREGQVTFDKQRAQLLETFAQITEALNNAEQGDQTVILGGETILLHDVAQTSKGLLQSLLKYAQTDQLIIGSWYSYLDGLLASGESFIRSLLLGRSDLELYGISRSAVAIIPDNYQASSQLPQILKSFGIDTLFVRTEHTTLSLPFNWQADDSSQILVIPYHMTDAMDDAVAQQRKFQPDGPFLWVHSIQLENTTATIDEQLDMNSASTTLTDFAQAMRERLPDEFRPVLSDALYLQSLTQESGRYSARVSLKQDIMRLEAKLIHQVETLLALALTFGDVDFPDIQKSLLEHSWRTILQNMTPSAFAGATNDQTHDEMQLRNRQVDDNLDYLIDKALHSLSGKLYQSDDKASTETYITVWNPHGYPVTQIVQLALDLPKGLHPSILLNHDDEEQPFTWDTKQGVIDFRATTPCIGYTVYTLKLSRDETAEYNQNRAVAGRSIGTASGQSLGLTGGRLDWTFANGSIIDLLNYYDGGDAGNIWQYQEPQPDVVMKASLVDVVQVEATPTYERLIFRNRMRIAPKLKDGKERVRGLRVLDLSTTATYHNGLSGIYLETTFTNTAEDHRLRVHLRTGIHADHIYTDSTFGLIKRHLPKDQPIGDLPTQGTVVIGDETRSLGVFTRGLLAVEPIWEDNQITLALTLLRAVGLLSKSQNIKSEGAQMVGDFKSEFMVMPLEANPDQRELIRISTTYHAPIQAVQYAIKPKHGQHSFLKIESENTVMTALKSTQNSDGLIIRLLNSSDEADTVILNPTEVPQQASHTTLAEDSVADLPIEDGTIKLTLSGRQIATVLLKF